MAAQACTWTSPSDRLCGAFGAAIWIQTIWYLRRVSFFWNEERGVRASFSCVSGTPAPATFAGRVGCTSSPRYGAQMSESTPGRLLLLANGVVSRRCPNGLLWSAVIFVNTWSQVESWRGVKGYRSRSRCLPRADYWWSCDALPTSS